MNKGKLTERDSFKTLLASLISILIGLLAGAVVILIVGLLNPSISLAGAVEGIKIVLFGVFSTGRNSTGALSFGFNPASAHS